MFRLSALLPLVAICSKGRLRIRVHEVENRFPQHLLRGVTEHVRHAVIDKCRPVVAIDDPHAFERRFDDLPITFLARAERFLRAVAFGDIPYKGAEQVAAAGRCARDGELDRKLVTVAMESSHLESLVENRPLAGGEKAAETKNVRAAIPKRNDGLTHQPAHRFGSRPTEDGFGHRVPVGDHAVGTHRDDRVQRGIEDAAKPAEVLALGRTRGLSFGRGRERLPLKT